jgi:hypothetical protein
MAICAAVEPLPYRFDASLVPTCAAAVFELAGAHVTAEPLPPAVHDVSFDVLFVGFTPAVVAEFWLALDGVSLLWPGAFPELPGDAEAGSVAALAWEFAVLLPLPLPARAEPENAVRKIASVAMPATAAERLIIPVLSCIRALYP